MTHADFSATPLRTARAAGLLYLVIILCGIGGEALVRGPLSVAGDPAQTAANLAAAELPFRLSMLADVVMVLSDVALAALLFVLFRPVDHLLSLLAMVFRLVQASVLGLNLLNLHRAVGLVGDTAFTGAQRDAMLVGFLDAHAAGYDLGLFFFGIDCLLVGALVRRAGFRPRLPSRLLGAMLSAAGVVYLVGSAIHLVAPNRVAAFAPAYVIPLLAELAFCVWLLRRGVAADPWHRAAPSAAVVCRAHVPNP